MKTPEQIMQDVWTEGNRHGADGVRKQAILRVIQEAMQAQHAKTWAMAMEAAANKCKKEGDDLIRVASWHDINSAYKAACSVCEGWIRYELPCPPLDMGE